MTEVEWNMSPPRPNSPLDFSTKSVMFRLDIVIKVLKISNRWFSTESELSQIHFGGSYGFDASWTKIQPPCDFYLDLHQIARALP